MILWTRSEFVFSQVRTFKRGTYQVLRAGPRIRPPGVVQYQAKSELNRATTGWDS
jgi:hypothetical protein